jgi:hypothetical protein
VSGSGTPGKQRLERRTMEITETDRRRMNSKLRQFIRFVVLNLKILKGVDAAKRS